MFEHLRWPHSIELVQYWESAKLDRCGSSIVPAELQGLLLSSLSTKEKYKSPYVVDPPEGHTYFDNILLYKDAAAKLAVDKGISSA